MTLDRYETNSGYVKSLADNWDLTMGARLYLQPLTGVVIGTPTPPSKVSKLTPLENVIWSADLEYLQHFQRRREKRRKNENVSAQS